MSARQPTARTRRPLRVHIGELRLEGFDPRRRWRIADALERELARLLSERPSDDDAFAMSAQAEAVHGGTFTFHADASPERIGVEIARATYHAARRTMTETRREQDGPARDDTSWQRVRTQP